MELTPEKQRELIEEAVAKALAEVERRELEKRNAGNRKHQLNKEIKDLLKEELKIEKALADKYCSAITTLAKGGHDSTYWPNWEEEMWSVTKCIIECIKGLR